MPEPIPPALPDLLRLLTTTAKLPLATAMSHIPALQRAGLASPDALAAAKPAALTAVFGADDQGKKRARAVAAAAKRSLKHGAPDEAATNTSGEPPGKRVRRDPMDIRDAPAGDAEAELVLPCGPSDEAALRGVVLVANRAPVMLAFAVVLLEATMPGQPGSSRLSLAQAVVSANARTKARSIGLAEGDGREEEERGRGFGEVTVLGRRVRVLRRDGYVWRRDVGDGGVRGVSGKSGADGEGEVKREDEAKDVKVEEQTTLEQHEEKEVKDEEETTEQETALWGLDLEALAKSNNGKPANTALPIHTPQAARAYLLKSFATVPPPTSASTSPPTKTPKSAKSKDVAAEKERNLGLLLSALRLLVASWKDTLGRDELDRRAWGWYVAVRPDVAGGKEGWGARGVVKLDQILGLRR